MPPSADDEHPLLVGRYGCAATVWRINPASESDRQALIRELVQPSVSQKARRPLDQVLKTVQACGCECVVVEERYIDIDYRSDYSAFWSRRFEDRRPYARRLHFFSRILDPATLHVSPPPGSYLGYSVLRPTELGPLGRTVIPPPPELRNAVMTEVRDCPSFFGCPLQVTGVPFCQQDGEFLVCAHTAAWLSHYVAYSRGIIGRTPTADIASIPPAEGSKHRLLPSNGLTGEQLQALFSGLGIPALFYDMKRLPNLAAALGPGGGIKRWRKKAELEANEMRERILLVVCKYVNSGFPVVVLTEGADGHAFTIVGWEPTSDGVRLVACDDQVGPYEIIGDPLAALADHRARWRSLMVPLPEKVYFTGDAAEVRARNLPELIVARMSALGVEPPRELVEIQESVKRLDGPVSVRARLLEGRRFKAVAGRQERAPDVVRLIRMAHLPHWVWLVEMHDRAARDRGDTRYVLAEWVFDSTAHDHVPQERLASTLSGTTDARERVKGQPREVAEAKGHGRPWRSLITDPELIDKAYGSRPSEVGSVDVLDRE